MSGTTQIWFGTRAVDFTNPLTVNTGAGDQVETITSNADFDSRTFAWGTFDNAGMAYQQLIAFMGTAAAQAALGINLSNGVDAAAAGMVNTSGDLRVGSGVTGQNIADMVGGGRIGDTSLLDQTDDVVTIGGFARVSNTAVGEAVIYDQTAGVNYGAFVTFTNATGFGLINRNGQDFNGNGARLNDGDSVDLNISAGNILSAVSFTVNALNGAGTRAAVILDSDGQVITVAGSGFAQQNSVGELLLGDILHGTKVEVDYDARTITIGGVLFDQPTDAFFGAFAANGLNNVTFGSAVVNTVGTGRAPVNGWSVDDLVLSFVADDGGAGPGAGGAILSFDWFSAGVDPAPTGLLNERMYAYLDADANNALDAAEIATARDMGSMRLGNFATDDPGNPGDDNPILGTGGVQWLEMYAYGMKNPALANNVAIPSGAQYGEHIGGNVATVVGDDGRFALSVHSPRNPAAVTPGGENGGPADVDGGPGTVSFDPTPDAMNNGEVLGFSLIARDDIGTASFATAARITFAQGVDLTPGTTADIIVRLYSNSTLLETITHDITGSVGAEETGSFMVQDFLGVNFNRMEIEAAGSMNGITVADPGARFVITDLDFFLA